MLNNKGQSLVLFVLVIPIILLIMVLVVDIGKLIVLKQELDGINYIAIDYGIDNIGNENFVDKIKEVIEKNKDDADNVEVTYNDNKLYITITDKMDGMMVILENSFTAKSQYVGYIENGKKIIKKVGDN